MVYLIGCLVFFLGILINNKEYLKKIFKSNERAKQVMISCTNFSQTCYNDGVSNRQDIIEAVTIKYRNELFWKRFKRDNVNYKLFKTVKDGTGSLISNIYYDPVEYARWRRDIYEGN